MAYATDFQQHDEQIVSERDIPIEDILEDAVQAHGAARMFELCYWAAEPGFFEVVRALYSMPEGSREALHGFLSATPRLADLVAIAETQGRLTLDRRTAHTTGRPDIRVAN
jgi:hypothetical protein